MIKSLTLTLLLILSTGCVYKLDIQQGNILDQKDIDKLRPELTKNQVVFVLGNPVVRDSFSDDKWTYLYTFKAGSRGTDKTKKLILYFESDKLVKAEGDFTLPEALSGKASGKEQTKE